jgi:hypothetical protein
MLFKRVRILVQHPSQLLWLRGEEDWDGTGQAACASEGGPRDWPGARHRWRHVVLAEERRGLHYLGWQRNDLQLELVVAFGGGADRPAVRAADDFVFPPLRQGLEESLALDWRSADQLDCYQLLLDAEKFIEFI